MRAHHLAVGRGQRRTDRERQALADGTAGQRQMGVRTPRASVISSGRLAVLDSSA